MSDPHVDASVEVRQEWLIAARTRLDERLEEVLGDRLRLDGGRRPPRSAWRTISDVDLTHRCGARFALPEVESSSPAAATLATRALGKLALAEWDGRELPLRALDRVVASLAEPSWLVDVIDELDAPARAAVVASAEAWMADVLTAVRRRTDLRWVVERTKVDVPRRSIRLNAACDARLGDRRAPTTLLVHGTRLPDPATDAVLAGFTALVLCYWGRAVPERVRLSTAGLGATRAVAVTPAVLDLAVERVVELASWSADPASAPFTPGGWCRWCHRLPECDAGRSHLDPT